MFGVLPSPKPDQKDQKEFCFVFDVKSKTKTYEEIIKESNYKFSLDFDVLINNSETTRLAERNKKKGIEKIPRPQNAWIIYRRDKSVKLKGKKRLSKDISGDIAKMWGNEPEEVKELFGALARMSEIKHNERYSDYKYSPKTGSKRLKSSKPKSPKSSESESKSSKPKSLESPDSSELKSSESKPECKKRKRESSSLSESKSESKSSLTECKKRKRESSLSESKSPTFKLKQTKFRLSNPSH